MYLNVALILKLYVRIFNFECFQNSFFCLYNEDSFITKKYVVLKLFGYKEYLLYFFQRNQKCHDGDIGITE